jgi:dedicator of cytokinesis protein 3
VMEAPALQLESLGTYKAEFVRPRYGDLRREVAALVRLVWDRLGSQQSRFVEDLVGPVAALMISHSEDVKSTAMSLFFALLQSEFAAEGNFHNVERRTIDALNQRPELVKSPEFKNTFTSALEGMFNGCGDEQLKAQGLTFLGDIKDLLEMMVALQGYPALPEYEDERTSAALKLMSYLRQTDRTELYTTYVDLLVGMHKDLGNMVEAGMAVMLKLEAARSRAAPFPEIERLYESAISHLSEGKDWEMAIRLCRELGNLYETSTYDYNRLADVLVREAELFRKIPSEDRFFAEYFRVGFWGRGFPAEYANKEFVYKGSELERVGDFAARIQAKFPKAEMVKKSERPPAEIRDGDGQHLQISTVLPSSVGEREGNPVPVDPRMPKRIQKYRSHNGINMFLHSRSIRKEKKGDNEFKSVWVMNAFLETEDHFPGVRRRSLIIGSTEIELSPIDNAINVIESKNDQLIALVATHQALVDAGTPPTNINEFTMVLNGVIDAAVNGGILKYSDAFFNEDFAREQPDKAPQIARLKAALNAQLDNTGVGLQLHRVLCSEEMIKLQEHLESSFAKMRAELADVLK